MKSKLFFICFFIAALMPMWGRTQTYDVDLKSSITPDSILIGDQVKLSLHATYDTTRQYVGMPLLKTEKGNPLEILETLKLDTVKIDGKMITIDQSFIVTSFDSGRYVYSTPVLLQSLLTDTVRVDTLVFPPIELYVNTIPIDTATYVMYDIKPIATYPCVIWDYWWIGAIILGLVLIAFGIWWFLRWRSSREGLGFFSKPKDPPYIIAITELQKLKNEKLWEQDKTKQYYTRLTDIIRQYIEDTYGLQAMEKTSEEILKDLKNMNFDNDELYNELKEMFIFADLAKFAKYKPEPIENERSYKYAYDFIEGTKPKPEEIENNIDSNDNKEVNTQNDNNTEI